jgi:hypothetical protein
MSKSGLLDRIDRRVTILHEEDGKQFIESRQDVTHIVAAAKIMADEPPGKDFKHVAFVPDAVLNEAFNAGWFHDPKAWKRWLNDPDNRDYRTGGGRI